MTPSRPTRWLTLGAFALDVGGRTMACVLRSNREMRALRVDIRPWLLGSQPQNPQEAGVEEAIMRPHLPEGAPAADFKRKAIPLRIAPRLDWMVVAIGDSGERHFFAVDLI